MMALPRLKGCSRGEHPSWVREVIELNESPWSGGFGTETQCHTIPRGNQDG